MFVSDERRVGPYDRRGAANRRRERAQEIKKIHQINTFKNKKRESSSAEPLLTRKRLTFLGLALVLIVILAIMAY